VEREDLWGCSLADGYNVWRLHQQHKHSLADLLKYTMTWHCIVCCPRHIYEKPECPGTRAAGIARVLRRQDISGSPNKRDKYADFPEPKTVEKLPERISVLRQIALSSDTIRPDLIFKLFGESPPKHVILQGAKT